MSTIRCVYSEEPNFPATDQHPDAVRYQVAGYWVDALGGEPSEADVLALVTPPPPPPPAPANPAVQKLAAFLAANPDVADLIDHSPDEEQKP